MTLLGFSLGGMTQTTPINRLRTNEMYDPFIDVWTLKKDMIYERNQFGSFVIDNEGYCIGGDGADTACEKYDVFIDSWITISNVNYGNFQCTASSYNNKGYNIGGFTSPYHIEEYDKNNSSWTIKQPATYSKRASAAFTLNDYIYACAERYISDVTERYNPLLNIWTSSIGNLNSPNSKGQSIVMLDTSVNGLFGYYMGGATSSVVERYDDYLNTWIYKSPFILARYKPSSFSMISTGYANGGASEGDLIFYTTTESYNPLTDSWTNKKECIVGRDNSAGFTLDDLCEFPTCIFTVSSQ